jgi:hypothetical protein
MFSGLTFFFSISQMRVTFAGKRLHYFACWYLCFLAAAPQVVGPQSIVQKVIYIIHGQCNSAAFLVSFVALKFTFRHDICRLVVITQKACFLVYSPNKHIQIYTHIANCKCIKYKDVCLDWDRGHEDANPTPQIEQLPQLSSSTASTVPFRITNGKMRPHWWETPYLLINRVSTPWSSLASKSMVSQLFKMHGKANELGSADSVV